MASRRLIMDSLGVVGGVADAAIERHRLDIAVAHERLDDTQLQRLQRGLARYYYRYRCCGERHLRAQSGAAVAHQ
jgi:hypothetical protein